MTLDRNSNVYRWYVVGLLLAVLILSYFDRYILSLLIEPLKKSIQLTDFQVGLLLGPAFSLFHVIVGIPLGWFADRTNRKYLLIGGVIIWCAMTTGNGFVTTFAALLLLRLGLGLGEAVVTPASISIISDYFKRSERASAISVYLAGPYLGAGLAFLAGGFIVSHLETMGHVNWPLIGERAPWQAAFIFVGIPGFIMALLMLSIREPERKERTGDALGIDVAFRYIHRRWRAYGVIFIGSACNFAMSAMTFWSVPLFQRVYGWGIAETGVVTGLFYFTAGPLGTMLAVWAQKRFALKHKDSTMRQLLFGLLIVIPASALYPIMPRAEFAVALMFVAFIGKSVATPGGPASMMQITPGEMRSQSMAIFNTVIALIGPLLGPPLIGLAVDASGDPNSIGVVLSAYVLIIGVPAILLLTLGLRHYRAAVQDMEEALET